MKTYQRAKDYNFLRNARRYPNRLLLSLFAILWLSDAGLTLWATNHGYMEVWNTWTMSIAHNWVFIPVKVLTLAIVVLIVFWANRLFPLVVFIALVVFNVLIVTVTLSNIVTLAGH